MAESSLAEARPGSPSRVLAASPEPTSAATQEGKLWRPARELMHPRVLRPSASAPEIRLIHSVKAREKRNAQAAAAAVAAARSRGGPAKARPPAVAPASASKVDRFPSTTNAGLRASASATGSAFSPTARGAAAKEPVLGQGQRGRNPPRVRVLLTKLEQRARDKAVQKARARKGIAQF